RPQDHSPRPGRPRPTPSPTPGRHHASSARPKKGGGDRPLVDKLPELVPAFHAALEDHTAGSPMKEEVFWTDLTPKDIQEILRESDLYVSVEIVRQLLHEAGYRRRQMLKY